MPARLRRHAYGARRCSAFTSPQRGEVDLRSKSGEGGRTYRESLSPLTPSLSSPGRGSRPSLLPVLATMPSCLRQPHGTLAVAFARLVEQRQHGGREGGVLGERGLHDAAAVLLDRGPRVALLLDGEIALPCHRRRDGVAHGLLQVRRPGVEGGAVQEDRARDVEV